MATQKRFQAKLGLPALLARLPLQFIGMWWVRELAKRAREPARRRHAEPPGAPAERGAHRRARANQPGRPPFRADGPTHARTTTKNTPHMSERDPHTDSAPVGGVASSPIKAQLSADRKATPLEGRPNRGDRIELTIDSFAHGARESRDRERLRRLRHRRDPRRPGARGDRQAQAQLRRGPHRRAARAVARPRRAARRPPRRALAGPHLRAPAHREGRAGPRRDGAPRRLRRPADARHRPRRRAVALPQQDRVLVRARRHERPRRRASRAASTRPASGGASSTSTTSSSPASA